MFFFFFFLHFYFRLIVMVNILVCKCPIDNFISLQVGIYCVIGQTATVSIVEDVLSRY